jgi:dTDP-4-dehydrorhamnose reductase
MTKVLILGSGGMLGSMVAQVLEENPDFEITTSQRGDGDSDAVRFDVRCDSVDKLVDRDAEWIVNAIGVIKPRIDESDPASVARAVDVNSAFPYRLAEALRGGQRVIQIATDCVYAGTTGAYEETAAHDPLDVYGKTKSLGEVPSPDFLHLRCSIIGPERGESRSLLGWLLSQPQGSTVPGFTNHRWNGVTTYQFAKLCEAVIGAGVGGLPPALHLVPGDAVSKAELLELIAGAFGRSDIQVDPGAAGVAVDRTLATAHPQENERLWSAAGYDEPPTIATMIGELASKAPAQLLAGA